MDKNDSTIPKKKGDKNRIITIGSLLISAVLFVVDLYVMINNPGNFILLIIVTLLLLVGIYFFINSILQEVTVNKKLAEEQYENIFKSGKASYLLLKKAYEQMEGLEEKTKPASTQDIITAQKAIAKVTISRNKENADALMNSNDKVLEKIFDFEERLGTNNEEMLDKQKTIIGDSMKELMERQQELSANIKEMESSLKSDLLQTMNNISSLHEKVSGTMNTPAAEVTHFDDMLMEEPVMEEETVLPEEPTFDSLDLGESENLLEEEPVFDSLDLGESENLLEEEPSFDSLDLGESENLLEEEPVFDSLDLGESENLLAEESVFDSLDLGESENLLEEEPVEEAVEEVAEEPKAEMPDLSDPHKLMTPDEIAALIANM